MKTLLASLQRIGGALMLPIAVLPIAGLLLRLGQPDLLNLPSMAAAGDAIFANLGLLFAIGVAVGLARENHGAAGLASVVGYLVTTKGAEVLIVVPPGALPDLGVPYGQLSAATRDLAVAAYKAHELAKLSVPAGILCGLIAGALYNRFSNIRLPSYLAFFGGRRFVPIASGFAGLLLALIFGREWQPLEAAMDELSRSVLHAGAFGLFAYGVLNRVLIVTGLHHIINNIAWFLLGDYHGVTGDLKRFFAGDPDAGAFMAGFFPVMMFGLPAACLAMYHTARAERRAAVSGLLLSIALTSLLTGVTEPIEFSFMFLAPLLYAVHALLTGLAFVLMNALHVRLGFGFSAGLFDYVLNFSKATHPLLLIPVGAGYFALYYVLFRIVIVKFNLATPGRENTESMQEVAPGAADSAATGNAFASPGGGPSGAGDAGDAVAGAWIAALGGAANIVSLDACTTRLRLKIVDQARVNPAELTRLGARGIVRPSATALQVVIGATADQMAGELKAALRVARAAPAASATAGGAQGQVSGGQVAYTELGRAESVPTAAPATAGQQPDPVALLAALGGRSNVRTVMAMASRLRINIVDPAAVNRQGVMALGVRGVVLPGKEWLHIIVGPAAGETGAALQVLLA
jgi:N-acetylglucosamine PTS system EIICBA or EIICB component